MAPSVPLVNLTRRPVEEALLAQTVLAAVGDRGVTGEVEVCVTVVGAARMRKLNLEYRGRSALTDVLAFGQEEGATFPGESAGLGDVVVCYDAAIRQAAERGHSVQAELAFLVCHGVLHLLGHDDDTDRKRAVMLAKQHEILQQLSVALCSTDAAPE